jgi:hypothetical protein
VYGDIRNVGSVLFIPFLHAYVTKESTEITVGTKFAARSAYTTYIMV